MWFQLYGGIFETRQPLNFYVTNSIVQTEYLNQGIKINTDCSIPTPTAPLYATSGEIVFSNYT